MVIAAKRSTSERRKPTARERSIRIRIIATLWDRCPPRGGRCVHSWLWRERQDTLEIFVVEPQVQADEVVAPIVAQDVVHAAEQPQAFDEGVTQVNAPPRYHRL